MESDLKEDEFKSIKSDIDEYVQYILHNHAIKDSDIQAVQSTYEIDGMPENSISDNGYDTES